MLTQEQVNQFNRDGYINGGPLLTPEQVQVLRNEMERVIADRDDASRAQPLRISNLGSDEHPVWQIVNIWSASGPFENLVRRRELGEAIGLVSGAREVRLWHDQIQYKPMQVGGVNKWHQDAPYWGIIEPSAQVTAWIALDDVDTENGCMWMVPGSHKWGNAIDHLHTIEAFTEVPPEYQGHAVKTVACPVKAGEVHFHHALTWHGSNANLSGRPRRAIALHLMTEATRYVAEGRDHPCRELVEVGDGQTMAGKHFPLVWQAESPALV